MAVDVGSAVGYLDLDINGFLNSLRSAQSEADKASKNIATKLGANMQNAGKKLTSAGSILTKNVTVPIVGLGAAAIKTSSDFESAMSKVSAISGATGTDLDKLNKKAQEMGAQTKFSATESAEAFTYMAMAGWKTEDMLNGIDGIMSLAAADGLDLATTSDIVTDALTAFGLSASDSGHFADVLAKAASNANTNVSLLGESFKYAAPVAGALGYSAEDTAIALGLMANAGIKASQGGTALRGALTRMIKPSEDAALAMEQYNLSMTNSDGTMKSLGEVMDMLRTNLGNLTEAEQAKAAATIFGQEAMSGMLAIINASDSDYAKLTDAIYNADGAARQMADTMLNNLSGQLTLFKSALEGLAIQFGEILMPYIKQFVTWLQNLTQKLQELTPEQKEQIVKWAAIAAAIGPVLMALGKLTSGIGSVITTFGKIPGTIAKAKSAFTAVSAAIGGVSAPVIAVVAVIGVLIAAFVNLWKTNEEFRNNMTAIWDGIKSKFESFAQGIVDRLNAIGFDFENFGEVVKAIWDGFCNYLAPIFEGAFEKIKIVFETVLGVITGIFDVFIGLFTGNWEQVWTGIKEIFASIWNGIKDTFVNIWNTIQGVLSTVFEWFGGSWDEFWNGIKDFFTNIWESIVSFFKGGLDTAKDDSSGFISKVSEFFSKLPGKIKEHVTNTFNRVKEWGSNMLSKAGEIGKGFLDSIVDFFKSVPTKIGGFITSAWENVRKWGTNMLNKAKEVGKEFLSSIVSFFMEIPIKIGTFISDALKKVCTWVTDMVKKAGEIGDGFLGKIIEFFGAIPTKIGEFIGSALDKVKSWASDMGKEGANAGSNVTSNVSSSMGNLASTVKSQTDAATRTLNSWVSAMGAKGTEAVNALVNAIKAEESNVKNSCKPIGKAIVDGVWAGMQNAKPQFERDVRKYFSDIVAGAKSELGINSPSKVMEKEIGLWLPLGVSNGFKKAMPQATKEMQSALSQGINKLSENETRFENVFAVSSFSDKLKNAYKQVAVWFESVESRINRSIDSMARNLANLIYTGKLIYNPDGTVGYIPFGGFGEFDQSRKRPRDDETSNKKLGGGDTYNFYSPKPIDEIEAARQMKKTKRDMAEGF